MIKLFIYLSAPLLMVQKNYKLKFIFIKIIKPNLANLIIRLDFALMVIDVSICMKIIKMNNYNNRNKNNKINKLLIQIIFKRD